MTATQGDARRTVLLASLLLFCSLLTGCFDTKQEITLNPDGSGKVVFESVFQQITPFLSGKSEREQMRNVTNIVRGIIEKAEGVEAWRDIYFHQREDGRAFFRGTAYFRSLNKLKLPMTDNESWSITHDGVGKMIITRLCHIPNAGSITLTNEHETKESIQRERAQFQALRPMLHTTVGEMRQDTLLHIPGTLVRSTNFETNRARVLRLHTDGKKLMAAIESRMFAPELEARRIAGEQLSSWDDQMMKLVYGEAGPVIAVIRPASTPLFDYDKEVAAARAEFSSANHLGLAQVVPTLVIPARDGAPAKVTVLSVESRQATTPNVSRIDSRQQPYLEMKLLAELSGEIFSASKATLERAVTLDGVALTEISWPVHPMVLAGRTNVSFTIRMTPPPAHSEGFAEVTGIVECIGPAAVRTVELVSGKLRGGAKGKEHNASIEDIIPNFAGGDKLLLRTSLEPGRLRSPRVVGDNGITAALQIRKHESFGDRHVYTLANREGIPRSGKLVAELLEGDQSLRVPFALTNVNLLGQPHSK